MAAVRVIYPDAMGNVLLTVLRKRRERRSHCALCGTELTSESIRYGSWRFCSREHREEWRAMKVR
ncbi:MAG: hypothetical protein JWO93_238 [Micrococcaceae bacterium]|nr:hypothetical protein [Micrococcaceae bacterium]